VFRRQSALSERKGSGMCSVEKVLIPSDSDVVS